MPGPPHTISFPVRQKLRDQPLTTCAPANNDYVSTKVECFYPVDCNDTKAVSCANLRTKWRAPEERVEERPLLPPQSSNRARGGAQKTMLRAHSVQPSLSSRAVFFSDEKDSRLMTLAETIRRPFMFRAKFGAPSNWALDIFTLPHNAIRAECVDLYNILESIQARSHVVDAAELDEFARWWHVFEGFLIEFLDFEADVLFSWVFPRPTGRTSGRARSQDLSETTKRESLMKTSLLTRKEPLLESLRQINGTFELRRNVDTTDVFHTILEEVNGFVPKLMDYFHIQEKQLPPIVTEFHSAGSKDIVTRRYVTYIKQGEAAQMNIIILTRWMDKIDRDKWIKAHVRGLSRLMYPRWDKRCAKEHASIPIKFHRRLLRSVRHVAASRLRRRTDFGEEIGDVSYDSGVPSQNGSFRSLNLGLMPKLGAVATIPVAKPRTSKENSLSRLHPRQS